MTADQINSLVMLLQAHTALDRLSNMEARAVFEFMRQRDFVIIPPSEPPARQPRKDFSIVT
jgi:hypothetical protein